jgi:hypothetical protein
MSKVIAARLRELAALVDKQADSSALAPRVPLLLPFEFARHILETHSRDTTVVFNDSRGLLTTTAVPHPLTPMTSAADQRLLHRCARNADPRDCPARQWLDSVTRSATRLGGTRPYWLEACVFVPSHGYHPKGEVAASSSGNGSRGKDTDVPPAPMMYLLSRGFRSLSSALEDIQAVMNAALSGDAKADPSLACKDLEESFEAHVRRQLLVTCQLVQLPLLTTLVAVAVAVAQRGAGIGEACCCRNFLPVFFFFFPLSLSYSCPFLSIYQTSQHADQAICNHQVSYWQTRSTIPRSNYDHRRRMPIP